MDYFTPILDDSQVALQWALLPPVHDPAEDSRW